MSEEYGRPSVKAQIIAIHETDPYRPVSRIARDVGCDAKYVSSCLAQEKRRVGVPGSTKVYIPKVKHHVTTTWKRQHSRNTICQYWRILDGSLTQCQQNTATGKNYCTECEGKVRTAHAQPRTYPLGGRYGL
jgi:hypothetical protein